MTCRLKCQEFKPRLSAPRKQRARRQSGIPKDPSPTTGASGQWLPGTQGPRDSKAAVHWHRSSDGSIFTVNIGENQPVNDGTGFEYWPSDITIIYHDNANNVHQGYTVLTHSHIVACPFVNEPASLIQVGRWGTLHISHARQSKLCFSLCVYSEEKHDIILHSVLNILNLEHNLAVFLHS